MSCRQVQRYIQLAAYAAMFMKQTTDRGGVRKNKQKRGARGEIR